MVIKYEDIRPIFVTLNLLEDETALSYAIAREHADLLPKDVIRIPVTRIRQATVKGQMVDLPEEIHIYRCEIQEHCTAERDGEKIVFYWRHDANKAMLFPYPYGSLSSVVETAMLEVEEEKRFEEAMMKVEAFPPEEVKKEALPPFTETVYDSELLANLPSEYKYIEGANVYDIRWFKKWKAKCLVHKAKRLINPVFLALSPAEKVSDRYGPYLDAGRNIDDWIADYDIVALGITDEQIFRWSGFK